MSEREFARELAVAIDEHVRTTRGRVREYCQSAEGKETLIRLDKVITNHLLKLNGKVSFEEFHESMQWDLSLLEDWRENYDN